MGSLKRNLIFCTEASPFRGTDAILANGDLLTRFAVFYYDFSIRTEPIPRKARNGLALKPRNELVREVLGR